MARLGKYRPSVLPILNLSLRGAKIVNPAPGLHFYLERAPDPEGVGVAAASQGQGKLINGNVDPKEEA